MNQATLLLIDDDPQLLDMLGLCCEDAGYAVRTATNGRVGLAEISRIKPDLVISDVNMPELDGFALCKKLREQGNGVPLLLLTSRDSEIDEALGLELGADDYVPKPFSNRVLLARVAALLRREALRGETNKNVPEHLVSRGLLVLDTERLQATWRGATFATTLTEFRLLEALARRPGIVHTRERLLDVIHGDGTVVADRLIDTYVRRLRRKLEALDPAFDAIETVIGAGYRWRE
jgi:DNA-binding response OmpR family regulator